MLTVREYQEQARRTDQLADEEPGLSFPLLGVFGETGSLLSEVKKKQRDPVSYVGYAASVLEEFGDVLWYIGGVASRAGIPLELLAAGVNGDDRALFDGDHDGLTFQALQDDSPAIEQSEQPSPSFERTLIQLSAEVGLLMVDFDANRLAQNRWALAGRLVSVLRTLRDAANDTGITLADAAAANLAKIKDRWPDDRVFPELFDASFPEHERFEHRMVFELKEVPHNGRLASSLSLNGEEIGDPLTDNRQDDDDYRFHDVFHMAYAAVMGWSPTLRRLLRRKRKSDPRTDETQDGARAVLIEEGVATWIFNHAQRLEFFKGIEVLDYSMLKTVKEFVQGYEAEDCPLWCWEEAILQGYEAFRSMRENRAGRLIVDLDARRLQYEPLP